MPFRQVELAGYTTCDGCPCGNIEYATTEMKNNGPVVVGTHPIPEKYHTLNTALGTWDSQLWQELIQPVLVTPAISLSCN